MDFKNTWFYKLYCGIIYPKSILSKTKFVDGIDFDILISAQDVFLLRRSDKKFDETFLKVGNRTQLRVGILKKNNVLYLSMNLFGAFFKEKYIKYRILIDTFGGEKWNKKSTISFFKNPCLLSKSISNLSEGCPIYINANEIHNISHPYDMFPSSDLEKYFKAFGITPQKIKVDSIEKYKVYATCMLRHDPLNLNYWHVEYIIKDHKNEEIKKYGAKWLDALCTSVATDVLTFYSSAQPTSSNYKIAEKHYIRV